MQATAAARIERAFKLYQQSQFAIAELAREIDQPATGAATLAHAAFGAIDVRQPPKFVRIAADGFEAKRCTQHVAVLLPQYGLMFSAEEPRKAKNHDEAVRFASETTLLGCTDWRLPEVAELQLLIDRSKFKPAIDSEAFPHTPTSDWYWSHTAYASDPGCAWLVYFYHGGVNCNLRYNGGFVRAVRSVPPSQ